MHLKGKLIAAGITLAGTIGNALADTNVSLTPNAKQGMENIATLPYVDKLMWVMDTVSALVPLVAVIALAFLAVKFYFGGWDSVENEMRSRRAFFSIIIVVLAYKVGTAFIGLLSSW